MSATIDSTSLRHRDSWLLDKIHTDLGRLLRQNDWILWAERLILLHFGKEILVVVVNIYWLRQFSCSKVIEFCGKKCIASSSLPQRASCCFDKNVADIGRFLLQHSALVFKIKTMILVYAGVIFDKNERCWLIFASRALLFVNMYWLLLNIASKIWIYLIRFWFILAE